MAYLEHEVETSAQEWMHQHQFRCVQCRRMVQDVESLVLAAAALPAMAPTYDLWSNIAARLDTSVVPLHGRGSISPHDVAFSAASPDVPRAGTSRDSKSGMSVRRLAIAATILITVSSAVTWRLARQSAQAPPIVASHIDSAADAPVMVPVANADVTYEREIAALRIIVAERFAELDSTTVTELRRNIAIIDKAIADSRNALEKAPNSRMLSTTLDRALETKLSLMRRVALL